MNSVILTNIRSEDGASSELRTWPIADVQAPVIVCWPAMGISANYYDNLAQQLNKQGFNVVIAELRGNGSSSVRASREQDFGYHDIASLDFPAVMQAVRDQFPNNVTYLFGHSLGGQLSALYLSQNPNSVKGLILCASCAIHYKGWKFPGNIGILFFSQVCLILAEIFGHFPGYKLGFGDREGRTLMRDWARSARTGNYKLNGSVIDYDAAMKTVEIPVLAINFDDDNFAPLKATKNLINKLSPKSTRFQAISGKDIEKSKADHFNWLKNPAIVATTIKHWIEE